MSDLTNLTDRLSHLRDRKGGSPILNQNQKALEGNQSAEPNASFTAKKNGKTAVRGHRERRFATDYFMLFVYGLTAFAVCTQFALIVWLDLL